MLGDITRDGVQSALNEYDQLGREAFLDKYGFGKARGYFVTRDGRRYDAKAICGAAHGYDHPTEGPLHPGDFSGGNATVAQLLEQLGFEVVRPVSNRTAWTPEERILALDLYLRHGAIGRTHPEVIALSEKLNHEGYHPDAGTRENFRNPNGVALKLANFAALDPSYSGTGMTRYSAGDEETWEIYAGDADLLSEALIATRSQLPPTTPPAAAATVTPISRAIEQRHRDRFEVAARIDPVYAERREAELVDRFATWLRHQGAQVTAHHYQIVHPPLRNDLADETHHRLWEAKADVSRSSVRMALGQLLDYLRFEPTTWTGGILLPHQPSADLIALIRNSGRAVSWPTSHDQFKITEPTQRS